MTVPEPPDKAVEQTVPRVVSIPLIFSDIARGIGACYPPYLAFSAVVGFVCMIGLWKMVKWAVFVYTEFVVLRLS